MTANVWDSEWDEVETHGRFAYWRRRVVGIQPAIGGSELLGASVWEIPAGATQLPYDFHHAQEEFLVVLGGPPTLRTESVERRTLRQGDVVFFPRGPDGGHQVSNRTEEAVRVLIVSSLVAAEVAEYPESSKIRVLTRGESQVDGRLLHNFRVADAVDYFEGEEKADDAQC